MLMNDTINLNTHIWNENEIGNKIKLVMKITWETIVVRILLYYIFLKQFENYKYIFLWSRFK